MAILSLAERAKAAAKKQLEGGNASLYNKAWKSKNGLSIYKPEATKEDGSNRGILRILPYMMKDPRNNPDSQDIGAEWFKRRWWAHRVGPNNVVVACLFRNFGKPCPVCELVQKMRAEGVDDKVIVKLTAKERELFNVFDHVDKKVKILDISTHLFGKKLLKEVNDPVNEGAGLYVDPGEGGMQLFCRFDSNKSGEFTTITLGDVKFVKGKAVPKDVLDKAEDLDAMLIELSRDDLIAHMDGGTAAPVKSSAAVTVTEPVAEKAASSDTDDLDF